jgi:hypothetical protein
MSAGVTLKPLHSSADEPTQFVPVFDAHGTEPSLVGSIRGACNTVRRSFVCDSVAGTRHLAAGSGEVLNPSKQPAWRVLLVYQRRP